MKTGDKVRVNGKRINVVLIGIVTEIDINSFTINTRDNIDVKLNRNNYDYEILE